MTFPLKRVHFQGNYLNFFLGVKLSLCHDWRVWFKYIVHLRYIWHGQYYHGYTAYHPIVVLDLFFQAIALLSTPKAMQSYCEPNADWRQHMPNVVRKHRVKYEYCAPPACQGNPSWELCSPIKLEVYSPPPRMMSSNKSKYKGCWIHTPENHHGTQKWRFGRWCFFSIGWFSGSIGCTLECPACLIWLYFSLSFWKRSSSAISALLESLWFPSVQRPPSGDWMRGRFSPIAYAHLIEKIPSIQVHFRKVRIILIQLHGIQGFQFIHVIWSHYWLLHFTFPIGFSFIGEASLAKGCDSTANCSRFHGGLLSLMALEKVESFSSTWRDTSHLTSPVQTWFDYFSWFMMQYVFTICLTKPIQTSRNSRLTYD